VLTTNSRLAIMRVRAAAPASPARILAAPHRKACGHSSALPCQHTSRLRTDDQNACPCPAGRYPSRSSRRRTRTGVRRAAASPGGVGPTFSGLAARGKTTLALEFAHRHQGEFEAVHCLPCQGRTLVQLAGELAWQLGLKLDGELDSVVRQLTGPLRRQALPSGSGQR
jgi:hypothetical protein